VIEGVRALGEAAPPVVVDLSLVRGLDYYTGLIFETTVPERRAWGSVCSGGRFDDLVTSGHPTPGVGGSIGLIRLFSLLVKDDFGSHKRQSPAPVTFIVGDWERDAAIMTKQAAELRHHGIGVEMVPMGADSLATHVTQANDRGARIVVSRASDGSASLLDQERAEQRCPVGELAAVIATALSGP
jgi:histidyl-tRNA synthetase